MRLDGLSGPCKDTCMQPMPIINVTETTCIRHRAMRAWQGGRMLIVSRGFRRLHVLVFMVLALMGCAPEPIRTQVDPSFTPEQTEAVLAAVEAWHYATDGGYPLAVTYTEDAPEPAYEGPIHIRPGRLTQERNGAARGILITIDTERASSYKAIQITTMHEIGHALGLEHHHDTLMADSFSELPAGMVETACIDAHTLAQVCARYLDCGPDPKPCGTP